MRSVLFVEQRLRNGRPPLMQSIGKVLLPPADVTSCITKLRAQLELVRAVCSAACVRKPPEDPPDRLVTLFDQIRTEWPEDKKARQRHFASSVFFNFLVVIVTLANTVLIGVESDQGVLELQDRIPFFITEVTFTGFFFVEMLLRINQLSWEYFMDAWNVFDYSLVVFSCADLVVSMAKENGSGLRWAASMRIFRAFRIARALKGEKVVVGLFRITQGFIDALPSVFWMSAAAFVFAYMLAVALTSLVGGDTAARELWLDVDLYCGTVSRSLYTILQVMTLDSVHQNILRPILSYAPLGLIVVYLTMLCLSFGTLNILLAIMVERMTIISQDTQESKIALVAKTEKLLMMSMLKEFDDCDTDFNGELDLKEFRKVLRTPAMTEKLKFLDVGAVEAENMFEMMDVDKSGALSPIEFLSGLFKVKGQAKGADLCRLITILDKNKKLSKLWVERMRRMNHQADLIQARLNQVGRILAGELKGLTEASARADFTWSSAAKRKLVIQENELRDQAVFPGMIATEESDDGSEQWQFQL